MVQQTLAQAVNLRVLIGSGDRIGLLVLPFLIGGVLLSVLFPAAFTVGGPPAVLTVLSTILLVAGLAIWLWSVLLIVTRVPRHELITSGPYSLVKHPLYTGVALLVWPSAGVLLNTWLGVVIGIVMYLGARRYAPEEERTLSTTFGPEWDQYCRQVKIPWL